MKRFGLIGHPIEHSQSPKLFKAAYGGKYDYELIRGEEFEGSWKKFLEEYDGINVTAPFKEPAFAKVQALEAEGKGSVSAECQAILATNLVVKTPSGLMACNSDYSGVCLVLLDIIREHPLSSALVVGCGGAGKAAIVAAMEMGLKTVVANRNIEKASRFAEHLKDIFGKKRSLGVLPLEECGSSEYDIVIYTLPVAIPGMESIRAKYILEANYRNPAFTPQMLEKMKETTYVEGKRWLGYQAYAGYRSFTGEDPDLEAIMSAI